MILLNLTPNILKSFSLDCEFYAGLGWSIFKPSFSQSRQFTATPNENDGCEKPGCYEDQISYGRVEQYLL